MAGESIVIALSTCVTIAIFAKPAFDFMTKTASDIIAKKKQELALAQQNYENYRIELEKKHLSLIEAMSRSTEIIESAKSSAIEMIRQTQKISENMMAQRMQQFANSLAQNNAENIQKLSDNLMDNFLKILMTQETEENIQKPGPEQPFILQDIEHFSQRLLKIKTSDSSESMQSERVLPSTSKVKTQKKNAD